MTKAVRQNEKDKGLFKWLHDTRYSLIASHAIRSGLLDAEEQEDVLAVSRRLPPTTRDLFETFIPVDDRIERLGNNIQPQEILAEKGNSKRGRELFLSDALSCNTCHSIEPGKESVGPNFTSLQSKQYDREVILQNILQPSQTIRDEYRTHVIHTDDGRAFSGVIKKDGETIVLRDAQNKVHRIAVDEIEFQQASNTSIMPEKLLNELTMQQARDLIEFLSTLNGQ